MAVTDVWADWSTTAASNSPAGGDTPEIDDELRNVKAQCKANCVALTGDQTVAGTKTFSSMPAFPNFSLTDYSSSSTVTGWGTPTKYIKYVKLGCLVFCVFSIGGTSNATTVSFTLPYQNNAGFEVRGLCAGVNNGSNLADPATWYMANGGATVTVQKNFNDAPWSDANSKSVTGFFVYYTTG